MGVCGGHLHSGMVCLDHSTQKTRVSNFIVLKYGSGSYHLNVLSKQFVRGTRIRIQIVLSTLKTKIL